jgi:polysaccharide deacetylase family protein (PEP-CTERM system associated)
MNRMKNALTFDVEDYFQVSAFAGQVEKGQWEKMPSRVEANTTRLMDLLAEAGYNATFFTLGWVARQHPGLVRQIAERGHEVACHSLEHRRVYEMTPDQFFEDTRAAKEALEDAAGQRVVGYRAPSFSITKDSLWAFEVLAELGFEYDSSIFPVRHPNYGMPRASRKPFVIETEHGPIVEFPMMTIEFEGRRSPLGGGAYLRLLPYWFTRWGLGYINRAEGSAACVYLHPWELDSEQPRINASLSSRIRHYLGLRGVETKLRRLLRDFDFQPLGAVIRDMKDFDLPRCKPFSDFPGIGQFAANGSKN